jgi:hypothetical protein
MSISFETLFKQNTLKFMWMKIDLLFMNFKFLTLTYTLSASNYSFKDSKVIRNKCLRMNVIFLIYFVICICIYIYISDIRNYIKFHST